MTGSAATEIRFGQIDLGSSGDLDSVFDTILKLLGSHCSRGFALYQHSAFHDSPQLIAQRETAAAAEADRLYHKAKKLLFDNREFVEAVAHALAENGALISTDICAIRERFIPSAITD